MCAWNGIAARLVMWYYFHAVCAHGGGICIFLWMIAKVSSCLLSPFCQPPESSGCSGPFCHRVPLRGVLPIYPWQPRALLQGFLWMSGCLLPSARGNKQCKIAAVFCQSCLPKGQGWRRPASGVRPYCRILQCSPGQGQLVSLPGPAGEDAVVGRCWEMHRIIVGPP